VNKTRNRALKERHNKLFLIFDECVDKFVFQKAIVLMHTLTQILILLLAGFLGWQLYKYVKANPQAFSRDNLNKSFFTLGILALLLIGFIALCVMILRSHG
jgi:hypothetical protein